MFTSYIPILVIAFSSIYCCRGLTWTSSREIPHNSEIQTCVGGSVLLPWNYTLEANEKIIDIEWLFQKQGRAEVLVASMTHGHFLSDNPLTFKHVTHLDGPALRLDGLSASESGLYTVNVNLNVDGSVVIETQNVTVLVPLHTDGPTFAGNVVDIALIPGVYYNSKTNDWHSRIACGEMTHRGTPKASLVFVLPNGEEVKGITDDGQVFYMDVPNPQEDGEYSCQVDNFTASCLHENPPSTLAATNITFDTEKFLLNVAQANMNATSLKLAETQRQLKEATSQLSSCQTKFNSIIEHIKPTNCMELRRFSNVSGVQTILLPSGETAEVYCDQQTDGGGWTVFQKRFDGSVDFYRNWTEYKNGFGNLNGEFWLGLDLIHTLTTTPVGTKYDLRVDLEKFDGTKGYASYSGFRVGPESVFFPMTLDAFTGGNAGDSLSRQKNMKFTTYDSDHDTLGGPHNTPDGNCAVRYTGAYWFDVCYQSHLNGLYSHSGICWGSFNGLYTTMKSSQMKIRPHL